MIFTSDSLFEVAAEAFYGHRQFAGPASAAPSHGGLQAVRFVRANTLAAYRRQTESLKLFFAGMSLGEIRWWHMRAYQEARVAGAEPFHRFRRPQDAKPRKLPDGTVSPALGRSPCPAKPQQVNQEMAFLRRLKKLAGCWSEEDDRLFQHLQEYHPEVPRSLTPEEQVHWLQSARLRSETEIVYLYSLIAFDTCCSPNELRLLRIGDINLRHRLLNVPWPAAKNRHRHREVEIEEAETLWAIEKLIERSHALGSRTSLDHLFPARVRRLRSDEMLSGNFTGEWLYDPARPMSDSGLKKAWQMVRELSGLRWFRVEDTRHTGATRLAEDGVPADIIMSRMGHVRPEMRLHYTHISSSARRAWLRDRPSLAARGNPCGDQDANHAPAAYPRTRYARR